MVLLGLDRRVWYSVTMKQPRREVSEHVMGRLKDLDPSRKIVAMRNEEGRYGFQWQDHQTGEVIQAGVESHGYQPGSRQSMGWRTPLRATIAGLNYDRNVDELNENGG